MKLTYLWAIYNNQSILFSNEQGSVPVAKECFIGYLAVLRGKINLLYPGGKVEVALLR